MSFLLLPSLKPSLTQRSVYFGHKTPPKKYPDPPILIEETHDPDIRDKMIKAKGDFMKKVGALSLVAPIPSVILGAATSNFLLVIGLTVLIVTGGSTLFYREFIQKFRELKAESVERIALEPKAQRLRMEKATGQSLDGMLANAKALNQVVFLYFSLESSQVENTVGDAKMFDLKNHMTDLAQKQKVDVRFIRYNLKEPGRGPSFKLPPTDRSASSYPCLAVLNQEGKSFFSEMGLSKMTLDALIQRIAPVMSGTDSDEHA